ncbi:MAG: hypothetical protein LQ338_004535 [Usnochroma carphineum]|nr:MAG: hypothetical protein LQ338_004535 [Usnochroma carphineum]
MYRPIIGLLAIASYFVGITATPLQDRELKLINNEAALEPAEVIKVLTPVPEQQRRAINPLPNLSGSGGRILLARTLEGSTHPET